MPYGLITVAKHDSSGIRCVGDWVMEIKLDNESLALRISLNIYSSITPNETCGQCRARYIPSTDCID